MLTFGILTFAFSTILGWSYYGEKGMEYLVGQKFCSPYRLAFVAVIVLGATVKLDLVWNIADMLNALMAIPNLIAILFLSHVIVRETRLYLWSDRLDDYPREE